MGVISTVGEEAVLNPIQRISDMEFMLMWKDMADIVRYTDTVFYRYMSTRVDEIEDDRIWFAATAIRIAEDLIGPWLQGLQDQIEMVVESKLSLYGSFWLFITEQLGMVYNETRSTYSLTQDGFIQQTRSRLNHLESREDSFTTEQLQKLNWLLDHYEDFTKLALDDIEYVINEVMGKIEPEIERLVNRKLEPWEDRLRDVELGVMNLDLWWLDQMIDIWAFVIGGTKLPTDQIEDAMKTVGEWFLDMIDEIMLPMAEKLDKFAFGLGEHIVGHYQLVKEQVDAGIAGFNSLTVGMRTQVRNMIAAAITEVGGGTGPPGPPGPMGSMGPAGPAGPIGPAGEGNGADVGTINRELYAALWNANAITTNTMTGVVDWMLVTYGERFGDLQGQLTPITEFFTEETKTALTDLVGMFGSPEAIINFLIPDSEGQESEVLDLMQILISMTFERSL